MVSEIQALTCDCQNLAAQLKAQAAQLQAQYASIPIPAYTWQQQGSDLVLIHYNLAAEQWTQGEVVRQLGKTACDIYHETPDVPAALWRCLQDRTSSQREVIYSLRSTRQYRHLKLHCGFVPPDLVIAYTEDISDRKQSETILRQQAERERLIGHITQRIRQSLNLNEILETTVVEVREVLQTDRVLIYRFNPDRSGVVLVESVIEPWRSILAEQFSDSCFMQNAHYTTRYQQGRIHQIGDVQHAYLSSCYAEMLTSIQVRANLVVPILQDTNLWGLLIAHHCQGPRQWRNVEIDLLQQLANQAGIAIQQAELYQQVQQLNTNLEQQVQQRTAQLQKALQFESLLQRITDKVRDSLDEGQILQTVVQELGDALQVECCDTASYDLMHRVVAISHEYTVALPSAQGKTMRVAGHPVYEQLFRGQYFHGCTISNELIRDIGQRFTILACPIADNRGILGDLRLLRSREKSFNEAEIRLVQQVANHCAIALRQARLYKAAQAQVEELERLNRLKDDFLSTVSHELRTPMSSIQIASQMLEVALRSEGLLDPENSKTTRYLDILQTECLREISLINDLLDLSRLDAGTEPLTLITIDPGIWLAHIAEPFTERTQTQQQTLRLEIPACLPNITTDLSYLERILSELLHNACKYTPPGETITLKALATSVDLQIEVSNFGAEIPEEERDRIFEKFYRIPNSDPWKHGGTGLGLALVKKLVEYLNGTIAVHSQSNQVTFTIHLPYFLSCSLEPAF